MDMILLSDIFLFITSLLEGAQSRYLELFWPLPKLPLIWRKPENNTLQSLNTKEIIIINHKGTRMVKDGDNWDGLQTTKLKNLDEILQTV